MILFLSPLPPPFYGSAMSSQTCLNVLQSSNKYNVVNIKVNYSKSFSDIETITLKKVVGYFTGLYRIVTYSKKFKPRLVYIMPATSGFAFYRDFSYALVAKFLNKHVIFHLRTQITRKEKDNKLKDYIFKKAFRNSKIIVLGKELKKHILSYPGISDTYILPNAIVCKLNDEDFKKIEAERLTHKKVRLVFISNMIISKGWVKTLQAADILKRKNIDFDIKFAGSWPSDVEKEEFYKLVNEYNLHDSVKYLGHINEEQKKDVLSSSDVMVFPTEYEYEALPRVIIEAYEYGIPVISTQNGAIPSIIIHGQTGYMLNESTPREIADYVIELTNKTKSGEMGRNARNSFISHYEESVFNKNFQNIIDDALNASLPQQFEPIIEA